MAVKKGLELVFHKEYNKALASFELALDEMPSDKKALISKNMIEKYLDAKKLFDEGKFEEAKKKINEIGGDYSNFTEIKEDIDSFRNQIDEEIKKDAELSNKIDKIRGFVSEKNYDEAKKVIAEIEKEQLNPTQKQQIGDLKSVIDSELARIDAEKKTQESLQAKESKQADITSAKAEELIKKYLLNNGKYVTSIIEVEHEENNQYVVHCYDIIVDHTATSGWYYVNKTTGNITSMF